MDDLRLCSIFMPQGKHQSWTETMPAGDAAAVLEARFRAMPALPGVIVTAGGKVAGLLSRREFLAALSAPYGREVFLKRPLQELMASAMPETLVLDDQIPLATACRMALGRADAARFEPILLTGAGGPRIIELAALLSAQADALEQALDEQRQLASELRAARRRAEYDAIHDSLTGLLNRKGFLAQMQLLMASSANYAGGDYGLLFFDLDRFKLINDSLGHQVGDELLIQVAERLATIETLCNTGHDEAGAGPCCVVGRHSGDEFVLLHAVSGDAALLWQAAQMLYSSLTAPYVLDGKPYTIGASIGMVGSLAPYQSQEAALRDADIAMYEAKRSHSEKIVLFETTMHALAERRLALENELREAVTQGNLILYFQPIMSFGLERPFAYEVLLRWQSPHGLLAPGEFIALAEETGMIDDIGFWTLEATCNWLRAAQASRPGEEIRASINISAVQLANPALPAKFASICAATGVPPDRILIELTEQSAIAAPERAAQFLRELKACGFLLALDDFGAGYSSLAWLHKLPVDMLKIDGSLTAEVECSASAAKIAAGILNLSNSLGLSVVANGVERLSQMEKLRELGFDLMQGFYFGRPHQDPLGPPGAASRTMPSAVSG
ncbi:MAG TPA: EAL domain-containing protein [Acidocella sp.]|nr:EAL domain-containing protein [Acidocella sp.]